MSEDSAPIDAHMQFYGIEIFIEDARRESVEQAIEYLRLLIED